MTRTQSRVSTLIATLMFTAAAPCAAQSAAQKPAAEALIELSFEGGSAAEYVQAVKHAANAAGAPANVIVPPELSIVTVPLVRLQNVSVGSALRILDDMAHKTPDGSIFLNVRAIQSSNLESPVYRIDTVGPHVRSINSPTTSRVWNISPVLETGPKTADVLTAIETALAMFGDEFPPPQIRIHEETNLLMARGAPEQIETIEQVFGRLSASSESERKEMSRLVAELRTERDAVRRAAEERALEAERMRVQLETMRQELDQNMKRLAEAQKESLHLRAEVAELTSQLNKARAGSSPAPGPR